MTGSGPTWRASEREHLRLAVLQLLEQAPGYRHNEHVIRSGIEYVGHAAGADLLRTELSWLAEQGLVLVTQGDPWVARATTRGCDVATGRARTAGVARPRPE